MSRDEASLAEMRARLERRANMARARLFHTIAQLDTRRHVLAGKRQMVKRAARPLLRTLAEVTLAATCVAVFARALLVRHRRRNVAYRIGQRLRPLHRAMVGERRAPIATVALRRVVLGIVGTFAAELGKRAARVVIEGQPSPQSMAAGGRIPKLGVAVVDAPNIAAVRPTLSRTPRR